MPDSQEDPASLGDDRSEEVSDREYPVVRTGPSRLVVLSVMGAVLVAGLLLGRAMLPPRPSNGASTASAKSPTSIHNDSFGDYDAALHTGKPIYVLFHSLS